MAPVYSPTRAVVFTCWKEIAQYLGKGVRTVQRWEQQYGLPVQRPLGASHKSSVIAHPDELDRWLKVYWSDRTNENGSGFQTLTTTVSTSIRRSHELRCANTVLAHDISVTLQALTKNCIELMARRQEFEDLRQRRVG
jgi:hypothetical protein